MAGNSNNHNSQEVSAAVNIEVDLPDGVSEDQREKYEAMLNARARFQSIVTGMMDHLDFLQ